MEVSLNRHMPCETEIKLAAKQPLFEQLQHEAMLGGRAIRQHLESTYFDTHDRQLFAARVQLRLRTAGSRVEQTLKSPHDGDSSAVTRAEWTCRLEQPKLNLALFPEAARQIVERLTKGQPFAPVARTIVARETRRIKYRQSTIDIAFDKGSIEAGDRNEDICELEFELKRGNLGDVLFLVRELPLGQDLAWSTRSKSMRAFALAAQQGETASKAEASNLNGSTSPLEAFRIIAWNCLNQLLRNYRLIVDEQDAEALHQSRVALRRLRVATLVFRKTTKSHHSRLLVAQWKAAANALGQGRNLDVLMARLAKQHADDAAVFKDICNLIELLGALRSETYRHIADLLSGPSFQKLLFDTAIWIEGLSSSSQRNDRVPRSGPSTRDFAKRTLEKFRNRVNRQIDEIPSLKPKQRHRLRIRIKQLRYATEFFAPLLVSPDNDGAFMEFSAALESAQHFLGELNDIAPQHPAKTIVPSGLDEISIAALTATLVPKSNASAKLERRLVKAASRAGKELRAAGCFWN